MADLSSFQCIPMAVFDSSTLTGTYASMNSTGFADDIKILKMYNGASVAVTISYDGVTDHDFLPVGATVIIDLQTNHSDFSSYGAGTLYGRKGQIIFGKGTAGTGNIYIIGFR